MAGFCLMPEAVTRFRQGLKSGAIHPDKLADMSSEERNKFFEDYVGKSSAKDVNALFESKLLLKNQQAGMQAWAKKVAGISESVKKDLISKITRIDKVLDPEDKDRFLKDLAATKLGVNVTQDEAKTIADLSKKMESARASMENGGDRLAYGRAKVDLANYVNQLKVHDQRFGVGELKQPVKLISRIASNAKAISASMDNSAIFRQGWKTLWTHPGIWRKNARQSFVNLAKQFSGREVMDEVHADIVSRPNYDKMVKAKLAVGNLEEAYPTTAPEKIPLFGRAYKATEAAYTAFVQKTRADVFDKYLEIADKSGVNTNDTKELQSIGKLVNSLTGRGSLGKLEPVGNTVNNVFFSPRFLKSNIDTLTLHFGDKVSPFARKQAAINLMKIISGTAAIIGIANAVKPGSVELDPRSSDFGKIRVGDTRFDVTGGMGSIVTLADRLITQSSKSSSTGLVSRLNSGKFGSQSELDVVTNFFENKLSPAAGIVRDLLKGQNPSGQKVSVGSELSSNFLPLGYQTIRDAKSDPQAANALLTFIADGLGISANTYGATQGLNDTSKQVVQFKQAVGAQRFKQANTDYTNKFNAWATQNAKSKQFQKLNQVAQQMALTKEKNKLRAETFKEYGFRYRRK